MSGFKRGLWLFLGFFTFRLLVVLPGFLWAESLMRYDSHQYWVMAGELLRGSLLSYNGALDFTRTPLWPLSVALCRALWPDPRAVLPLNALLWALAGVLLWRVVGGRRGLFAAGLLMLSPLSWKYSNSLMSENMLVPAVLLAYLASERWRGFWAGAGTAWAALVKPIGLLLLPLSLLNRRKLAYLLGFGATASLWALRNWLMTGALTFSTITDVNALFYIAPRVLAKAEGISLEDAEKQVAQELRRRFGLGGVRVFYGGVDFWGDPKTLAKARSYAWEVIREHPKEFALLTLKGVVFSLAPPVFWRGNYSGWRALNEALVRGRFLFPDVILPLTLYSFAYTLLFYLFLLLSLPKTDRVGWLLVALAAAFVLAPGLLGSPRFRLPAEPLLLIASFRRR